MYGCRLRCPHSARTARCACVVPGSGLNEWEPLSVCWVLGMYAPPSVKGNRHGQAAIQNTAARLGGRSTAADHLAVLNAAIAAIAARCRRRPGGG